MSQPQRVNIFFKCSTRQLRKPSSILFCTTVAKEGTVAVSCDTAAGLLSAGLAAGGEAFQ